MSHESGNFYPNENLRAVALEVDRHAEAVPLPGADQTHYTNEAQRQAALVFAERANIAHAAGELGMTSDEWLAKRSQLGRSPNVRDA